MKSPKKIPSLLELTKRGDAIMAVSRDVVSELRANLALNVKIRESIAFNDTDTELSPIEFA